MNVRFGYGSPHDIRATADILRLAEQADRDGLDLFSLSDHPYLPDLLDPYATLAFVLGRTSRISALANVTNLPLRPAPVLARTASSLTALSGGRFVLGLGAGGAWDKIESMGVPRVRPAEAVEAFEQAMILVRRLSGGGPAVTDPYHGVTALAPSQLPAPPIWTGSNGPRSLAATGRQADGWIPGHAADWLSERYRESRPIIDEAALSVGRKPADVATIYNFPGRITAQPLDRVRDEAGRWIGGSPAQWVEELTGAVLDHGAAGFILFPQGSDSFETTLSRWSQEVAPAVRAAVS
ncbi:LLM class flavin-dependent oxidoreductase [Streptomyces sp. SID13031]|uniref:LLM class flavin-dependent oxidoreductase n=1 Tax=Streptomyces sp. SID13031 TaxID=2706046 RepID=UPI0013CDBD18|nr:LLM class flavin-dependent oxidoreductase [Streptomyces sp. SID13031]NEA36208.1 LLM class flavin-dependent oxidoreductase [Streptomyces sp. SID13031]